ncbi:RecX family transcriptional regulator [Microbacterium sp. SMR1]|nr:RecX family transcriptional regulator [Microbacterium sp. SMR1]
MSGTDRDGGETERLAPVIPLFGQADAAPSAPRPRSGRVPDDGQKWHTTWTTEPRTAASRPSPAVRPAPVEPAAVRSADEAPADDAAVRARAERTLLKRLRGRSLSVREARDVLREAELAEADADAVIAAFLDNGYLDDSRLAEQLLDGALGRKAQGATAIAQTLSRRGLDREVIDIAMASLPDDEAERALEFARQRARGMSGLDHDVALRRLHGQLARRGFRGSVALDAARQALSEQDG